MSKEISLIIAVYNGESTISRCLDCATNQDFDNYEIILINDGSTDSTHEICRRYADSYDIIRYFQIENSGISFARNYGIKLSAGKYIAFSDADDIFTPEYLSFMYTLMHENNADMVINDTFRGMPDDHLTSYYSDETSIYDFRSIMRLKITKYSPQHQVYGKLIEREILQKTVFPVGHTIEDFYVFPELCYHAKRILYNHSKLYQYCYDKAGSIMRSSKSNTFVEDQLLAYRRWMTFMQDKDTELWKLSIKQYLEKLFSAYGLIENGMVTGDIDDLKRHIRSELDETYSLFFAEVKSFVDISYARLIFLIKPKYFIMKHFLPLVKYRYKDFYKPSN